MGIDRATLPAWPPSPSDRVALSSGGQIDMLAAGFEVASAQGRATATAKLEAEDTAALIALTAVVLAAVSLIFAAIATLSLLLLGSGLAVLSGGTMFQTGRARGRTGRVRRPAPGPDRRRAVFT